MKALKLLTYALLLLVMHSTFTACSDEDEQGNRQLDATFFGEWIENDGNRYIHGYLCFYRDGTGISGSYESDIDLIHEDDEIEWYTVDGKYLYMDGVKYEYDCDGSSLEIVSMSGKRRSFYGR